MKSAVAQISCSLGDPKANLSKVRDFSRRAKDVSAELIVFPEMTDTGYSMSVIQKHANEWTSGFVPGLRDIASQLSIAIVSGVSERDGSSIYNSQILVDANGDVLAQARAIENQSYVIASNRVGKDDELWFCGNSAIIDPRGVVIAAASADREELIHADLSRELVLSVRSRVESFAHRRPELYR